MCHGLRIGVDAVFPVSKDFPARALQGLRLFKVSGDVPVELAIPELGVRLRSTTVHLAPVPEVAVEENCEFGTQKGHIRPANPIDHAVNPVPHPGCMEQAAKDDLKLRVPGTDPAHDLGSRQRRFLLLAIVHSLIPEITS